MEVFYINLVYLQWGVRWSDLVSVVSLCPGKSSQWGGQSQVSFLSGLKCKGPAFIWIVLEGFLEEEEMGLIAERGGEEMSEGTCFPLPERVRGSTESRSQLLAARGCQPTMLWAHLHCRADESLTSDHLHPNPSLSSLLFTTENISIVFICSFLVSSILCVSQRRFVQLWIVCRNCCLLFDLNFHFAPGLWAMDLGQEDVRRPNKSFSVSFLMSEGPECQLLSPFYYSVVLEVLANVIR